MLTKVRKVDVGEKNVEIIGDSVNIVSTSILERRCENCEQRKNFPLAMTNIYGDKNLKVIYNSAARFNKKHKANIILPLKQANDSMYYFSKQEWTKRIWGKKPEPNSGDGIYLIISHNFNGSRNSNPYGNDTGEIEIYFEFIKAVQGKTTEFTCFRLTRGLVYSHERIKYLYVKRILKRLVQKK